MHILISGAGIAGPMLARCLAETNIRVTIVEKSPTLLSHGQNVDIRGSAITAVKMMGLLDEVRKLNTTEKGTQFIDPRGRPFARFAVTDSNTSPTSEFEILRGDLAKLLYEATKDQTNVTYVFGTTVSEFFTNEKAVKVKLSNGEVRNFDLLVAADGQWSRLRRQCFPPKSIKLVDKGLYVAYWTVPRIATDDRMWNVYHALGSRVISTRPDPHGTTRTAFSHMPCNDTQKQAWQGALKSDRQSQEELVRREFADAGWQAPRLLDAMDSAPDFYFQAVQQIKMSQWSVGRVVCLGDSAHAPTPLTGMGTSLALIGAYVLAGELSKLDDDETPEKALQAYETALRPFVENMQYIPFFIPAIAHPETAWKRWLVQTLVSMIARVWAVMAAMPWLTQMFGGSSDDDQGFPLPHYPRLIDQSSRW